MAAAEKLTAECLYMNIFRNEKLQMVRFALQILTNDLLTVHVQFLKIFDKCLLTSRTHCRVMYYCSRKHQIKDWPVHKELCKLITEVNKNITLPTDLTAYEFNQYKLIQMCMMGFISAKNLEKFVYQIWMYPRVCEVCFSREVTIICQGCLNVAYCSESHKESHKGSHEKFCGQLKLFLEIQKNKFRCDDSRLSLDFRFKKDIRVLPKTIDLVIKAMDFTNKTVDLIENSIDLIMMTDHFSTSITILHALEKTKFVENRRGKKRDLIIHIVHPSLVADTYLTVILEYLSHWIINLKHVGIFQIAPDRDEEEQSILIPACEICTKKRFIGIIKTYCTEYENILDIIPKPDLILLSNENFSVDNFHYGDGKSNLLQLVPYEEIPLLLTCYSQRQMDQNIATIPPSCVKFFVEPQANPYASQTPVKNWEVGLEPVLYEHKFISVFAKQRLD